MTMAEAPAGIRRLIDGWTDAIRAHDLDRVMSFYVPDVASPEVAPPLRFAGLALKRRVWAEFFDAQPGEIDYQVKELEVTRQGDIACVRSINQVISKKAGGEKKDQQLRWTACLKKFSGQWLVVHDHLSMSFCGDVQAAPTYLRAPD